MIKELAIKIKQTFLFYFIINEDPFNAHYYIIQIYISLVVLLLFLVFYDILGLLFDSTQQVLLAKLLTNINWRMYEVELKA